MISSSKLQIVQDIISASTKEELIWINGYLSGLLGSAESRPLAAEATAAPAATKTVTRKLTIVYGTETGNSKTLATEFAMKAKKNSLNAKLVSLDQYRLNDLTKEEYLLAVISTHGEGDPPDSAKKFYDHIHQNCARLEKLKFAVLALGDTSYPLFCKAGEDVDIQLEKLGASRILPLQKCDVDFEEEANGWFGNLVQQLAQSANGAGASAGHGAALSTAAPKKSTGKQVHRGRILTNIILNDTGSNKQTHHIEIEAEDVEYLPGDSLGMIPENPGQLVEPILALLGVDPNQSFPFRNEERSIVDLLKKTLNIYYLPERVVGKYAALVGQDIPATRIGLLDLLRIYPLKNTGQLEELLAILEPIAPRLYSISSSPEAHSGEIHLTVALDKFQVNEECKYGLCSDYLSRLPEDTEIEFYIHKNNQFRLPQDDRDIIMIGPGTGIAPFRSFIAHRDSTSATGANWLFFGDQHFVTDFLYQTELLNWVETGVLSKLNVAFSRDRKEKLYVQHKMLEHGKELYNWIEKGASIYVCGAREPMSADVERTLCRIIGEHGGKSEEEAARFIDQLKSESRYLKDVY